MRENYNEINETGYQTVIVAPSNREYLEQFVEVFGPFPYQIYGDPKRKLFRKMGNLTMPKWKLLLQAVIGFIKHGKKAFIPDDNAKKKLVQTAMKTQDIYIQGSTWVFNNKGKVIWKHIDTEPGDHASIRTIINVLRKH
ncbi:peroxiredoxin-like family protein [Aquibacillus halophilus]|uniref:peroxiredoxin-like family protein n=1 Tax=Aquibacillus halophilus TaxID=930132 RepID=UPI001F0FBF12